jgi:Glutathione S-transferase
MTLILYDFALSGNCHKIRLLLSFLDLSYTKIPISVKASETKTPEFLRINPLGQVPVLVDQDLTIRDSLAILVYLVRKYANDAHQHWLPPAPAEMAQVLSGTELEFVIMVIAVSCVKLLSAHNSTQHTSRKHKV